MGLLSLSLYNWKIAADSVIQLKIYLHFHFLISLSSLGFKYNIGRPSHCLNQTWILNSKDISALLY